MSNIEALRFPVFSDKQGNRFVFPAVYSHQDKSAEWGYRRAICAALGVTEEPETFDVIPETDGSLSFPHLVADATSGGFRHGGSQVWLIGGPKFDAATP